MVPWGWTNGRAGIKSGHIAQSVAALCSRVSLSATMAMTTKRRRGGVPLTKTQKRIIAGTAAVAATVGGLYALYRKRKSLKATMKPRVQKLTPEQRETFVKESHKRKLPGKTADEVVERADEAVRDAQRAAATRRRRKAKRGRTRRRARRKRSSSGIGYVGGAAIVLGVLAAYAVAKSRASGVKNKKGDNTRRKQPKPPPHPPHMPPKAHWTPNLQSNSLLSRMLQGSQPEVLTEQYQIQTQTQAFCGLHAVINVLIREPVEIRNKFNILQFYNTYILMSKEQCDMYTSEKRHDHQKNLVELIKRKEHFLKNPYTKNQPDDDEIRHIKSDKQTIKKFYNSHPKEVNPLTSVNFDTDDITSEEIPYIIDWKINHELDDNTTEKKEQNLKIFFQATLDENRPDIYGNFNVITIQYAIKYVFKLKITDIRIYHTFKLADIQSCVEKDTDANNRYILGNGGHWTACVPIKNGSNVTFLKINSMSPYITNYQNKQMFLTEEVKNNQQVIIFSGRQCTPPLHNLSGVFNNVIYRNSKPCIM